MMLSLHLFPCHDIIVTLNSNGMVTIRLAQIDNGSTDNCTIISLSVPIHLIVPT